MRRRKESIILAHALRKVMRTMKALAKEIRIQARAQEDLFDQQDLLALADKLEERVANGLSEE